MGRYEPGCERASIVSQILRVDDGLASSAAICTIRRAGSCAVAVTVFVTAMGTSPARSLAQAPTQATSAQSQTATGVGQIRGRVVDSVAGHALSGGSITVRRSADSTFAGGAFPNADGTFSVNGLTPGKYTLRVRVLGFSPVNRSDVIVSADAPIADVGSVALAPVAVQLAKQTVTAERTDAILAPDRNSYSVKNMATAAGGTAVDALRNIPAVEVDATDNVSLNGSPNVVVQVNGRASPLHGDQLARFLAQIPARSISRVEVATNPSAKDDPEGTAGIINIVLDQDVGLNLNGGISASVGSAGATGSGNLGKQTGRLALFASSSATRDARSLHGTSELTDSVGTVPASTESATQFAPRQRTQGLTLRSEYRIGEHDVLAADALATGGSFSSNNAANYSDFDASHTVVGRSTLFNAPTSRSVLQDYSLSLRRSDMPKSMDFVTLLRYTDYRRRDSNVLSDIIWQPSPSVNGPVTSLERDVATTHMPTRVLQTDFARFIAHQTKLEAGFKATSRTTDNAFAASFPDSSAALGPASADRATRFDYSERIGAAYAVISQGLPHVESQVGLRLEQASTTLGLPNAAKTYRDKYASVFPSAILIYHLTDHRQAKLSYSRRITRPEPVQLNPESYQDRPRSIFQGNPALRPEYTDAMELGLQDGWVWGTAQLTPFVRRTSHAIRYIRAVDSLGTTHATFENVASTLYVGSNLNVTFHRGRLNVLGGGSAFQFTSDAGDLPGSLSVHSFGWSVRSNATWKFSPETDGQVFAHYLAPMAVEGGRQASYVMMNLALQKRLWHDQGSFTVRLSDPFNVSSFGIRTQSDRVSLLTRQSLGTRVISLVLSRTFGQQLKLHQRQTDDATPMSRPVDP